MNPKYCYPFEKLRVWQSARELVKQIYTETRAFPQPEIYGLISQCKRAAVSVTANVAEGSARKGRKDQAHFSEIAYGSLMELACLLIVATDVGILPAEREHALRELIQPVSSQLNALHRSQLARIN
jgi:four helix bundle protein